MSQSGSPSTSPSTHTYTYTRAHTPHTGGARVVRWCRVNSKCRSVLLVWKTVGQGPTVRAVGAGGGGLDIFSLIYHFSVLSPSLLETAQYRLKYCLKGPLSPKQPTNQPTNHTPHHHQPIKPTSNKIRGK